MGDERKIGFLMLPPEIIDKLKKERDERERSSLELPLYRPEITDISLQNDKFQKNETHSNVIVIDLV
jgi:hypothetical protein